MRALILLLVAAFPLAASAQVPTAQPSTSDSDWAPWNARRAYRGGLLAVSWLPAIPVGNMTTKLPNATVHGLEVDARVSVGAGLTIGIDGSWQTFWRREARATYNFSTSPSVIGGDVTQGAVTAQVWRYLDSYQARGTIAYHLEVSRESRLVPYVKLGFGVATNRYEINAADLTWQKDQVNFAFAADVGTLIDLRFSRSFGTGFLAAVRYNVTTAQFGADLKTPMSIGFLLGVYASF